MQTNIKTLHVQRNFWKPHGKTSLFWAFYYVNDDTYEGFENSQIICCILCHKNPTYTINPRIQVKKELTSYF